VIKMTVSVKNQNEGLLYYTFRELGIIGELLVDDDGTDAGDYADKVTEMSAENQAALVGGTYGDNLYVKVNARAQGDEPVVLEVVGTDEDDAAATQEVTIPARTQVDQGIVVPEAAVGKKWKTVTSVLVKGTQPANHSITVGTKFKLLMVPQQADYSTPGKGGLIKFDNGFGWNKGTTSRAIPLKYEAVDHYKRQRAENTLNISQFYTVFGGSLQFLRDRDVTIKLDITEDGSAEIAETYFFSKSRLNVPVSFGGDGADGTMDADGNFREMFII
jgi:hypothetical protein